MQSNNVFAKEASKVLLEGIALNMKIYVPRIAKTFDLGESVQYDGLTDAQLD